VAIRGQQTGFRSDSGLLLLDLKEFSVMKGIMYLDSYEGMRLQGGSSWEKSSLPDDGHPSEVGTELVAQYIVREILNKR
jgi:hypothetical protein